jgi:hypothetical protein
MDVNKSLPVKIQAHEANLIQTKNEIQKFIKMSEGLLFDQVGLDALVGAIPGVGGMYTGIMGVWLLLQSYKVRAENEDKLMIVALTFIDVVIGILPIFGDIIDTFLRVHALNGSRLITHIDKQLSLIENTREQLNQGFNPDLDSLENLLLR